MKTTRSKSIELDGGEVQRFLQWLGLFWGYDSPSEKVQFEEPQAKKDTISRAEEIRKQIIKK